jgi:hypothetical protein
MSRVAAIDHKRLADRERGEVGTKKQNHVRYFCWPLLRWLTVTGYLNSLPRRSGGITFP